MKIQSKHTGFNLIFNRNHVTRVVSNNKTKKAETKENSEPVITEAHSSLNMNPESRSTFLHDARILSCAAASSILSPAVAISLISVSPQLSLGIHRFANSTSSATDPPAPSGSSANADSPGFTRIDFNPSLPENSSALPDLYLNTCTRVPVLPPSTMIRYRKFAIGEEKA